MDEYDREFTTPVGLAGARLRKGYSHERSTVTAFVVQLEYLRESGDEWRAVVRSDHDPRTEGGHDVTKEGVHLDVYREGEKIDTKSLFGPLPAADAFDYAEGHITEHAERYINRFTQWHRNNQTGSDRQNGPRN